MNKGKDEGDKNVSTDLSKQWARAPFSQSSGLPERPSWATPPHTAPTQTTTTRYSYNWSSCLQSTYHHLTWVRSIVYCLCPQLERQDRS